MPDSHEITERAARGDGEAMRQIVAEHYPAVLRFCARRLGMPAGEDATQDTFILAWRSLRRFDGKSTLRTWLFGVANNACRNLARKRRIEMTFDHAWAETTATANPEPGLLDRETLRGALAKLSAEHREVVVLHELEGLTYEEAAQILNVPVGTVKSRLNAAFQNLRRNLLEAQR